MEQKQNNGRINVDIILPEYVNLYLHNDNYVVTVTFHITKEMYNFAFTENGDKAYLSTGSYCLDYFSIIGGMRYNYQDSINLFLQAYYENPKLALKLLFFVRDIKDTSIDEKSISSPKSSGVT